MDPESANRLDSGPPDDAESDQAAPIEEMDNAVLLESAEASLLGARLYFILTDDNSIALGDALDAIENLLLVVKRLAATEQRS